MPISLYRVYMPSIISKLSVRRLPLIAVAVAALLTGVLLGPGKIHAQRNSTPASVAQVGVASPLPVYVVNDAPLLLPEGFVPGSSWKFTTWTVPSTLTFTATVQKTDGGWAALTLSTDPPTAAKWYFIPQMPGVWEIQ
jgi:hypothetical protein